MLNLAFSNWLASSPLIVWTVNLGGLLPCIFSIISVTKVSPTTWFLSGMIVINRQASSTRQSRHNLKYEPTSNIQTHYSLIPDSSIAPLQVHYYSEALPNTALILCWSWHAEVLQGTTIEGLAQDLYISARMEFKPETLQMQGTKLITESTHHAQNVWTG